MRGGATRIFTGRLRVLLLLVAVFAIYAPSLSNTFAMDDRLLAKAVLDGGRPNEMVCELRDLSAYFAAPYWKATGEPQTLYRPLTIWSFAWTYRFLVPAGSAEQREALPHHLINVMLHLLAVVLVYRLIRRLTEAETPALVGALVFGFHAIHSEVVATVVGRAELLAACFGGGALLCFARGFEAPPGRAWRYALAAGLLFLGLCSKESAIAWAALLPVFVLARGAGADWRTLLPRSLAHAVVVAGVPLALFLYLRARMIASLSFEPFIDYIANPLWHETPGTRLMTACKVWGHGLLLTLFPFRLACDYGPGVFELVCAPTDAGLWISLAVLLATLVGGVRALSGHGLLFLAATTFLGFSFLTSNVPFAIGTIFGERLYYVPSLGLSFLVAWSYRRLPRPGPWRVLVIALTGIWLAASALVVLQRNGVWKNNETLFRHAVRNQPRSARLHLARGTLHVDHREWGAALEQFEAATRIEPGYAKAWNNIAAVHLESRRLDAAESAARRGLAARHLNPHDDAFQLHAILGAILERKGKKREALSHLRGALAHKERSVRTRVHLLRLGLDLLSPEELAQILRRGEELGPGDPHWRVLRSYLAHKRRRFAEAEAILGPALRGDRFPPLLDRYRAWMLLADSLAHLGRRDDAIRIFTALARDERVSPAMRAAAQANLQRLKRGG